MAAEQVAAQREREAEEIARLVDVRALLHHPEFVRYARYWIGQSGCFASMEVFGAEVYALNARRAFGMKMWNEIMKADPKKVTAFLDLTSDDPES